MNEVAILQTWVRLMFTFRFGHVGEKL